MSGTDLKLEDLEEVPDGAPSDELSLDALEEVPDHQLVEMPSGPRTPQEQISTGEAFTRGARDTAGMGFSDESAGMGAWLADLANGETPRAAGRGVTAPVSDQSSYDVERDYQRAADEAALEQHPYAYRGGEAVGLLGTIAAPGVGTGKAGLNALRAGEGTRAALAAMAKFGTKPGATMGARALAALKVGAPIGAINALGGSTADNPTDLAIDTGIGAASGAVLGPVLGETIHQGVQVAPGVAKWLASKFRPGMAADEAEVLYGKSAPDALKLADPTSQEGAALRADALAGEDPSAATKYADEAKPLVTRALQAASPADDAAHALTYGERANLARDFENPSSKAGQKLRKLASNGESEAVIDKHTEDLSKKVDELWHEGDEIKWEEDIEAKRGPIKNLLSAGGKDPQSLINHADAMANRMRGAVEEMAQTTEKGTPEQTVINKLRARLNEYDKAASLNTDANVDVAADRWMNLDQLKRQLQNSMKNAKSIPGSGMAYEFEPVERALREGFEDPEIWGEGAAVYQQARNIGWRNRLLLEGKDAPPSRAFLSDASGEQSRDPFYTKRIADPKKVKAIITNAGKIENRVNETVLREWANREADLLERLVKHVESNPVLEERAFRAREHANAINDILDARRAESEAAHVLQDLSAREKSAPKLSASPIAKGGERASLSERSRALARLEASGAPEDLVHRHMAELQGTPLEANPEALQSAYQDPASERGDQLRTWLYEHGNRDAQIPTARLNQRTREVSAAATLAGMRQAERGQPQGSSHALMTAGLGLIEPRLAHAAHIANVATTALKPSALSSQASRIASLERAAADNPNNEVAARELAAFVKRHARGSKIANVAQKVHAFTSPGDKLNFAARTVAPNVAGIALGRGQAENRKQNKPVDQRVEELARENPEQLGEFASPLADAAKKSPEEFAAMHARMVQTDPGYQEFLREQADADEEHDDSAP